jgi:serine phosphatase RsbU (regulator of sigma subunit)
MVTLIKSLFNTMGNVFYLPDFFHQGTRMIKTMRFGNLYMGLLLLRIRQNRITVASAGMPPVFIYRADSGEIEEIIMKSMPLGSFEKFDYEQKEIVLQKNDAVLVMSDGYSELFNRNKEVLDYQRVKANFRSCVDLASKDIIRTLSALGDNWQQGEPQNDDITFIVLKYKPSAPAAIPA